MSFGGVTYDVYNSTASAAQLLINHAVTVDITPPTVKSVAITGAVGIQNKTLNAGDVVSVTVVLNDAVIVTARRNWR